MYSYTDDAIYTSFYGSNSTTIQLPGGKIDIEQISEYPFDGTVKMTIFPKSTQGFTLKLRIPTWSKTNQFVPGELYRYVNKSDDKWSIKINDNLVNGILENGFVSINRQWMPGDQVELYLPMPVRFNKSAEKVEANIGRIAVTRGPLVYAAEGIDNGGAVQRFYMKQIPDPAEIKENIFKEGLLKNVVKILLPANEVTQDGNREKELLMVPYYTWNNRGVGSMIVWLAELEKMVRPAKGDTSVGGKF
jgi:DUF1680 family protein